MWVTKQRCLHIQDKYDNDLHKSLTWNYIFDLIHKVFKITHSQLCSPLLPIMLPKLIFSIQSIMMSVFSHTFILAINDSVKL